MFLGMKSSRGALIITTKTPTRDRLHFGLTAKWGSHGNTFKQKPLGAAQYAYLLNEALQNDGRSAIYTAADRDAYQLQTNPFTHPNVDWYDELMKKNALSQSYNLNVSGGGKVAQFFVSLGYTNEQGLFKTNKDNGYNTDNLRCTCAYQSSDNRALPDPVIIAGSEILTYKCSQCQRHTNDR